MTYLFLDDFSRRKLQVKRYLAVVSRTEREAKSGQGRKIETERLHVLRAGTFLILYNLVEASARGALEGIHDVMAAERVAFSDLTPGLRREIVKGFMRNGNPDVHDKMIDVPVEFVTASLDVEYHFSGNVDAKRIREIAATYGFSIDTDNRKTHNGKDLLVVKTNRNDLAHGDKTYDEVGRDFTARDLIGIGYRTMSYVEGILLNVAKYLDDSAYKNVDIDQAEAEEAAMT
ncbi:MAE_28990/MAE_18760 family HEPN-like nuclease [Microvirga sp. VF16]|uniref:MAE_28990/MAE_18760 family HEPN-like nuclease n=1 Tax=Microvirga sp. VF16 TaxID=2807101 RepID=UPI00193DDF47|nr:MAE_28990/MAE_18760 family HEPN-like nuclease [Microvirga sp. VF16]QRM28704.1 hypothetical protein JO965_21145 [Microvirga sp. VF16]